MLRQRNPAAAQGPSPCSVCKVLRKGCQGNCELSECFPISRLAAYKQAHAIFGSAHIKKIVKTVRPEKMKDAADSILVEADFWKRSPRIGCLGVVLDLYEQIDLYERQLELVNHLLSEYRLFVATWMVPIGINDGGGQAEQETVTNDFNLNVMAAGSTMLDDPGNFSTMSMKILAGIYPLVQSMFAVSYPRSKTK